MKIIFIRALLSCSCDDSPFEALNSKALCSKKIQRCHIDSHREQPPRGWRTLSEVGVGQREESVLCFQSQHWQQLQCLHSPSRPPGCVTAGMATHFFYVEKRLVQVYRSRCVFLPLTPVEPSGQDQTGAGGISATITLLAASMELAPGWESPANASDQGGAVMPDSVQEFAR